MHIGWSSVGKNLKNNEFAIVYAGYFFVKNNSMIIGWLQMVQKLFFAFAFIFAQQSIAKDVSREIKLGTFGGESYHISYSENVWRVGRAVTVDVSRRNGSLYSHDIYLVDCSGKLIGDYVVASYFNDSNFSDPVAASNSLNEKADILYGAIKMERVEESRHLFAKRLSKWMPTICKESKPAPKPLVIPIAVSQGEKDGQVIFVLPAYVVKAGSKIKVWAKDVGFDLLSGRQFNKERMEAAIRRSLPRYSDLKEGKNVIPVDEAPMATYPDDAIIYKVNGKDKMVSEEIDCNNRTISLNSVVTYNNGTIVKTTSFEREKRAEEVVPESVGESLLEFVCNLYY